MRRKFKQIFVISDSYLLQFNSHKFMSILSKHINLTLISLLKGERLIVNKTLNDYVLTEYLYQDIIFNKPFSS